MIDGDPNNFLEVVYSGQDINFRFDGVNYFYQDYWNNGLFYMEIWEYDNPDHPYLWQYQGTKLTECLQAFVEAPIFKGKSFWKVEKEITWLYLY